MGKPVSQNQNDAALADGAQGTRGVSNVGQIDSHWLTAVLRASGLAVTVRGVESEPIGTGQMGSCFRLTIDYADGDGPRRLVVKLPAADESSRAAGALGYRCEVSFYREFADRIQARVPRCYLAALDDSTNEFTLLLEDMAPKLPGDQIAGCSVGQAEVAAVNVAGLHGPTWNDPRIRSLDWLIPEWSSMVDFTAKFLAEATEQFLRRYSVDPSTESVLQEFVDLFTSWATRRSQPYSLVHGDYRPDNLLFDAPHMPDPVVAVDWQVVSTGLPLRDIALLLATGLTTQDRRSSEYEIVSAYHRRLVELGVTHYDLEHCWDDYRYAIFYAPFMTVVGAFVAQRSERGDRMFTVMAERSSAAITDLDAFELLFT